MVGEGQWKKTNPSVFVVDGGFEVFGRRALFKVNFGSWHDG